MWSCLLLLLSTLALFLQLAGADDSNPKYMVVFPARLSYPSNEKLCMDLSKVTEPVVLNVTMESKTMTHVLLDRFNWHEKQLKCITFRVPPPEDDTEEVAVIRLSGAQGKIDEKKSVLIQKAETRTFIQTDKPIYTPGQLEGGILGCKMKDTAREHELCTCSCNCFGLFSIFNSCFTTGNTHMCKGVCKHQRT